LAPLPFSFAPFVFYFGRYFFLSRVDFLFRPVVFFFHALLDSFESLAFSFAPFVFSLARGFLLSRIPRFNEAQGSARGFVRSSRVYVCFRALTNARAPHVRGEWNQPGVEELSGRQTPLLS
jgi:hypothetical protein